MKNSDILRRHLAYIQQHIDRICNHFGRDDANTAVRKLGGM